MAVCVCVQVCAHRQQQLLLVLASLSHPLGAGWEGGTGVEDGTASQLLGWKNTRQCLKFAGCL